MKKLYFCILVLALISINNLLFSQETITQTFTFNFNTPQITTTRDGIDDIKVDNLSTSIIPYQPALPVKTVKIFLPPNTQLEKVIVSSKETQNLRGFHKVRLNSGMIPYSFYRNRVWKEIHSKARYKLKNLEETFYQSENIYPEKNWELVSIQKLGGYKIAILNLYPLQYIPADGKLIFTPTFNINFQIKTTRTYEPVYNYPHILQKLEELIDNKDSLTQVKTSPQNPKFDYLIISSENLLHSKNEFNFQYLGKFLEKTKGYKVKYVSLEEIKANIEGSDLQQKIRNYIRQAFENWGIKYVLLGGDADTSGAGNIIPTRPLYAKFTWDGQTFEQDLPSDLYYACLDGTFNYNGNEHWGEIGDGDNGDEVDLLAEVYVGRSPVENEEELANFVQKTIAAYQNKNKKVIFMGENLFPGIWGKYYMDELIKGASTHGFTTIGYEKNDWEISTLYDHDKRWSAQTFFSLSKNNYMIINHIGHSNTSYTMKFYNFYLSNLQNTQPFFLYTQGCYCGRFVANDCIIENMITKYPVKGAFATVANTSYGLGPEDPDPDASVQARGASQYLHRSFTDLLNSKTGLGLGELNQLSKEEHIINWMKEGTARWVYWEATLLGDPSFTLR